MQLIQILWDRRDFFLTCLLEHIRISLTAVVCAGVLGILTGVFISRHKKAAGIALGVINVVYTVPSISLLGFLIPFTGIGDKTAVSPSFWTIPAGALLGAAAAIGNFYYLCRSVQRAAAADEMTARLVMRSSYSRRMLITVATMAVGFVAPWFHWLATLIPFLLPRLTILVMQLTGRYKPDEPKTQSETQEEG